MRTAMVFVGGAIAASACLASQPQATPNASSSLTKAWEMDVEVAGLRHLTVGMQAAVVSGSESGVTAYSLADGGVLWRNPATTSAQPVALGRVAVLVADQGLLALDQATGAVAWRIEVDHPDGLLLTATDDRVFASAGAELSAWRDDGTLVWRRKLPAAPCTRVVRARDVLVLGLADSRLAALDPATGELRWEVPLSAAATDLTAVGDEVFVPTADGRLHAFRVDGGLKRRWVHRTVATIGPPATSDRRVYCASVDNTLKAFDRRGGSRVWVAPLDSRPVGGPLLLGDELVVPLASAALGRVTAATGRSPAGPKAAPDAANISRMGAAVVSQGTLYGLVTTGTEITTLIAWRLGR